MRAWKQAGATRIYFVYDKAEPVIELNSSGEVTATNIIAPDGLVARRQGVTDIYYLFDQQGSVASRLNGSGATLSSSTFDGFGMETRTSDQQDPFGYNAQYGYFMDRETGLYLCTYRYYDPAIGRFLNRDPVGYDWTINLYGYCQNNPLSFIDPLGLWSLYRWIYTGDGNASDEVYEAALDGGCGRV